MLMAYGALCAADDERLYVDQAFECKPLAGTCHAVGVTSEPSMTKL